MVLKLQSFDLLVAEKDMRCDAHSMWLDLNLHGEDLSKGVSTWYSGRHGIKANDIYVYYQFVDEETAEILELNCRVDMDKLMLKYKFYPKYIVSCMERFFEDAKKTFD